MLIGLYIFISNVVIPQIGAYAQALFHPVMIIILTLVGIVILFGAVGIPISNNLGSTIVGGIFRAIGYLFRTLVQAIVWIFRNIFRFLHLVFNGTRRTFNQIGIPPILSNIWAAVVVIIIMAIII